MSQRPIAIIDDDGWLEPNRAQIAARRERFEARLGEIEAGEGGLRGFASAHHEFGIHRLPNGGGWVYREWAPRAESLALIGDFNDWDRSAHPLAQIGDGCWEVVVADADGLEHGGKVKVHVVGAAGGEDRIPAYAKRAVQDPESHDFAGQVWCPDEEFAWTDKKFAGRELTSLLIYEAHIGMAGEEERVATYREFADVVLPRVAATGYSAVQLMAIAEHPYYGSFGYHVSNFFAPSSRFGTPEDLKYLVDRAHSLGVAVLMDVVHSHAVKNRAEGLAEFDGSPGLYFHEGGRGEHPGWDSLLFDYGRPEVQRFLLSNLRYWLEEFHFDGFRFDGVTSMLYHHHGDISFDHYDRYFDDGVDADAVTYLQLANRVIREARPGAITVAEDFSGMPGLCRLPEEGGIGFDYRLGMGVPDHWIKLLKHSRDEDWDLSAIWGALADRRHGEKTVAYAESHDQALVGDKTIAFWLMDKEMYFHMRDDDSHPVIDRGIALHKMIRLLTMAAGGEAFLTFMGNEFGHPEWVDFPREGNEWSYKHARRQWSLADNPKLKYRHLGAFEAAMLAIACDFDLLAAAPAQQLNLDAENKCLIFERANLIFAFNFHPDRSIPDYRFTAHSAGEFGLLLDSDADEFGGFGRIQGGQSFETDAEGVVSVYLPSRSCLILVREGG